MQRRNGKVTEKAHYAFTDSEADIHQEISILMTLTIGVGAYKFSNFSVETTQIRESVFCIGLENTTIQNIG